MKRTRENGFVIIVVIVIMSLFAMALIVISASSVKMAFESETAALHAQSRNLTASAIVWAQHNTKKIDQLEDKITLQLDVTSFNTSRSTCNITLIKVANAKSEVNINTKCTRGRRTLTQSVTFDTDKKIVHQPNLSASAHKNQIDPNKSPIQK